jgi:hypothetical protein
MGIPRVGQRNRNIESYRNLHVQAHKAGNLRDLPANPKEKPPRVVYGRGNPPTGFDQSKAPNPQPFDPAEIAKKTSAERIGPKPMGAPTRMPAGMPPAEKFDPNQALSAPGKTLNGPTSGQLPNSSRPPSKAPSDQPTDSTSSPHSDPRLHVRTKGIVRPTEGDPKPHIDKVIMDSPDSKPKPPVY